MPTVAGLWADLVDLVLPAACAGCRAERVPLRYGFCPSCAGTLQQTRPRSVRPDPAPPGLPPCFALGPYAGVLREALLSYKERGRHGLARPLGGLLAEVVATAVGTPRPLLLIPVPATAQAVRARHGDHLRRLCGYAAGRLACSGWPVAVARPLRALPRADSTTLDQAGRAAAALAAFRPRPGRLSALARAGHGRTVVLLDDIVTTGATLSAVTGVLAAAGSRVDIAAVLAATERRRP
ncbi:phosphoribosyltransferase family protein [Micromonospora sp. CPCC 206060]|uniref:ComF family protein n=1 Tax=Micromonospora sp. CPCC 206060 TaxID=3122406 RepID=UPI002FEFC604